MAKVNDIKITIEGGIRKGMVDTLSLAIREQEGIVRVAESFRTETHLAALRALQREKDAEKDLSDAVARLERLKTLRWMIAGDEAPEWISDFTEKD